MKFFARRLFLGATLGFLAMLAFRRTLANGIVAWGIVNLALLFFLAIAGLAVYAVMLGGWASNSKYSLLGGLRSTAQTISYEVFMGLALMGIVIQAGSFNLKEIVASQAGLWNIVPQFLGFLAWVPAALAVAQAIYVATFGYVPAASMPDFIHS